MNGQAELLEVVGALGAAGGLPRRLDGRQQQCDQDGDDGDDDQQFDQREAATSRRAPGPLHGDIWAETCGWPGWRVEEGTRRFLARPLQCSSGPDGIIASLPSGHNGRRKKRARSGAGYGCAARIREDLTVGIVISGTCGISIPYHSEMTGIAMRGRASRRAGTRRRLGRRTWACHPTHRCHEVKIDVRDGGPDGAGSPDPRRDATRPAGGPIGRAGPDRGRPGGCDPSGERKRSTRSPLTQAYRVLCEHRGEARRAQIVDNRSRPSRTDETGFPERNEPVLDEELRRELTALREEDMRVRAELLAANELCGTYVPRMEAVHVKNAARLRELIERHGWPAEDIAGKDGAEAAWLIAQHAIGEPEFRRCRSAAPDAGVRGRASSPGVARGLSRGSHRDVRGPSAALRQSMDR